MTYLNTGTGSKCPAPGPTCWTVKNSLVAEAERVFEVVALLLRKCGCPYMTREHREHYRGSDTADCRTFHYRSPYSP